MLLLESQQSLFEFENNHQSSTKQDSLTDMAATENCTDQSPNQWLRLTKRHLLPSVDIGTDCLPLFSGLIRIIPLYDFVVLPNWEFYPSSLPLSVSLCCPVQSCFFSADNCALPSASTKITLSQISIARLTSNKHQYSIIMETFKSLN